MKLSKLLLLAVLAVTPSSAATIADMQFISDYGGSGVFIFDVNGVPTALFCDQFLPNAVTIPYQANVATLADLTGTFLVLQGDPNALFKYQRVAILDLIALGNPAGAEDSVRANRHIFDPSFPLTPASQILYDFALAANANDYDLTGFKIYTNAITQELTGFDSPEPAACLLMGSGLAALVFFRRRRTR